MMPRSFKPKPKIVLKEEMRERKQIKLRIKRRNCTTCAQSKIFVNIGDLKMRNFIFCLHWKVLVRISQAKICPHFIVKQSRAKSKRRKFFDLNDN